VRALLALALLLTLAGCCGSCLGLFIAPPPHEDPNVPEPAGTVRLAGVAREVSEDFLPRKLQAYTLTVEQPGSGGPHLVRQVEVVDGGFDLAGLPPPPLVVRLHTSDGRAGQLALEQGHLGPNHRDLGLEVPVRGGLHLSGKVLGASGAPVVGAHLVARSVPRPGIDRPLDNANVLLPPVLLGDTWSGPDGAFDLPSLGGSGGAPGEVEIQVDEPSGATHQERFALPLGTPTASTERVVALTPPK
jgi:hypothetical protein